MSTQVTTTTTTTLENIPVKKGMQEQPTVATKRKHIDYSVNPEIASALEEAVHQTLQPNIETAAEVAHGAKVASLVFP